MKRAMGSLVGESDCVRLSIGLERNGRREDTNSELEEHDSGRRGRLG